MKRRRSWWAGPVALAAGVACLTPAAIADASASTEIAVPATANATTAPGTAVVTGVVYADRDGDGRQSDGERGIEGATVSDGAVLARTDASGRYTLTVNTERRGTDLVFVSTPRGFVPSVDEQKIPRFYTKVSPDEAGNASADFPLRPDSTASRDELRFIGLADVHVQAGTTNNKERFSDQIGQVNEFVANARRNDRPAFVMISGDLTNNATPAEFADFRAGASVSTVPVWPAIGNHEYNFQSGNTYGAIVENYRQAVGPEWYSFTHGDKHFVVLDNIQGLRQDEQYRWLEQDLALNGEGREIVVITHIPLNTPQATDVARIPQYVALLERYGTRLLLAGHTHSNDVDDQVVKGALHAVTTSSSYSIDQTPNGFRDVRLEKRRTPSLTFREYGAARSLTLVRPAPAGMLPQARTQVEVNAYHTSSEVTRARLRVDRGDWLKLRPSGDWTWSAELDARRLRLGDHRIEVEATEASGKHRSESAEFTVTAPKKIATPRQGAPWATFHGDAAHTGKAADVVEPPLQLAWSHLTGGKILTGSPAVAGGTAFIGVRDENGVQQNSVLAVDLATGRQRWRVHADAQVEGSPAVEGDTVFATSIRGTLYALDAATGDERWRVRLGAEGDRVWSYQAPTVSGGVVYQAYSTGGGAALKALDAATGAVTWTTTGLGSNWHSHGTAAVGGGLVFAAAQGGRISAVDAATGKVRWSRAPAGGWTRSAPVFAGNLLLMTFAGDIVVAVDPATGVEKWRYRSGGRSYLYGAGTATAPAVADGVAYAGFADGGVTALDLATGRPKWTQRTGHAVISSPAVSGGVVYVGSNDGSMRGFDTATGQPLWSYTIGPWVASSPAVSGNTLVVGAYDGNLYAFTPSGGPGVTRWSKVTGVIRTAQGPAPDTRVVIRDAEGAVKGDLSADAQGGYSVALPVGSYRVEGVRRGHQPGSVDVKVDKDGETVTADLTLTAFTGPVAGESDLPLDYGAGSSRTDTELGQRYGFVANDRLIATIGTKVAANNAPGTAQPGWLSDLTLSDATGQENLDWSELILTKQPPGPPDWNRPGEWLPLPDIKVEGDRVIASGRPEVAPDVDARLTYRALPGAPVVKMTLELTNKGSTDFNGSFQYLLDPDTPDDTSFVPGIAATNPGFISSGWTGNYIYDGARTSNGVAAQGIAWLDSKPVMLTARGYVFGAWFDASVAAGQTKTITWYHITGYPAAGGDVTADIAKWAGLLATLDH